MDESPYRILLSGIDSLDFGVFVEFDQRFHQLLKQFRKLKREASGTNGRVILDGRCEVLPGGKPNYPYQFRYPGFHVWFSRHPIAENDTPNVFVSLRSQ